jgi:hypothetical protein
MARVFRSHHGTMLTADKPTGLIVANPRGHDEPRAWQKFTVAPIEGTDKVSIRTSWGAYVEAHGGGGQGLTCTATALGEWGHWGYWIRPDGRVALQASNGQWVRVGAEDEGYAVTATKNEAPEDDGAGAYEIFTAEEVADEPGAGDYRQIRGQLTYDDGMRCIKDDDGPIHPCFTHIGDGFALYTADPDRARWILSTVRDKHYTGTLSWSILNDSDDERAPWRIPPYFYLGPRRTPDFWKKAEGYARLHEEFGLVWLWCAGGLDDFRNTEEARQFQRDFCTLADTVGPQRFVHEVVNELHATSRSHWHDPNLIDDLADIVRDRHPRMIVMTSSLGGVEDPARLAPYNRRTRLMSHHQFRGFSIGNKADHPWTMGFEALDKIRRLSGNHHLHSFWGTEPCGPWSDVDAEFGHGKVRAYVSVQDNGGRGDGEFDDESLGLIAMKNYAGRGAFNYFSAPGVKFFDGADFNNYPGFGNIGKLVQMLPQDMWAWGHTLGHAHPQRPWSHLRFLDAVHEGRADGVFSDDGRRSFTVINGINNIRDREWSYRILKNCHGRIIHPGTLEVNEFSRRAGEELRLQYRWGRGLDLFAE